VCTCLDIFADLRTAAVASKQISSTIFVLSCNEGRLERSTGRRSGSRGNERSDDVNASMKASKAKTPILAAGGILLRGRVRPEIALVQLRKMGAWVLPKGKLASGESAIAAAQREVTEETGHRVSIHQFLGTLAYETGGRQKIVQFWRMHALGGPVGELMRDVKAMEWLALDEAIERLSHAREQVFLEQVGPTAIRLAERRPRRGLVRRHRPAATPRPEGSTVPELVALPTHSLTLAPSVDPSLESRVADRSSANPTLLGKTWGWLLHTAVLPKPQRD
jgi:8-oxo-dGTP pyrophosphatase MutT (NUDIX family)